MGRKVTYTVSSAKGSDDVEVVTSRSEGHPDEMSVGLISFRKGKIELTLNRLSFERMLREMVEDNNLWIADASN